jgi:16S rRNA processing protein RimM
MPEELLVVLGRIIGVFGVRGWVKVMSETDPPDNILHYSPWQLCGHQPAEWFLVTGQRHGKGLIARLEGCQDRDQAQALVGLEIAVRRSQLPPPGVDEFYWADLEGLRVETTEGIRLGQVSHLLATGANDVLVVRGERERLIPFIWDQVVRELDLAGGRLCVDWDPDF